MTQPGCERECFQIVNDENLSIIIKNAVDRFADEQGITREEALAVIARDWLIGLGYLRTDEGDEEKAPASI